MRFLPRFRTLAVALSLIFVAASLRAQVTIGINFTAGTTPLSSSAQPGVIAGANWNNVNGSSGSNISLVDGSGGATSIQLTFNSQGSYGSFGVPQTSNSATNQMYTGAIFTSGGTVVTITLSGIPYGIYDIYTYASADSSNNSTLSIGTGSTRYYYSSGGTSNSSATDLLLTTSTNSGSPTMGPAQYQLFSGLTGSSVTFTTTGGAGGVLSNNVFGLELVAVPEPSTVALGLGLSALGLVWAKRRRATAQRAQ